MLEIFSLHFSIHWFLIIFGMLQIMVGVKDGSFITISCGSGHIVNKLQSQPTMHCDTQNFKEVDQLSNSQIKVVHKHKIRIWTLHPGPQSREQPVRAIPKS